MFFQQIYLSQETSSKALLRLNQDSNNTFYRFSHVGEEGVDMSTPDGFFFEGCDGHRHFKEWYKNKR